MSLSMSQLKERVAAKFPDVEQMGNPLCQCE
jgi:hypothetical protein